MYTHSDYRATAIKMKKRILFTKMKWKIIKITIQSAYVYATELNTQQITC